MQSIQLTLAAFKTFKIKLLNFTQMLAYELTQLVVEKVFFYSNPIRHIENFELFTRITIE